MKMFKNYWVSLVNLIEVKFAALKSRVEKALIMLNKQSKPVYEKEYFINDGPVYPSLEEYKQITGKRFRRSKEEIAQNLSPEEAFLERQNKSQL